MKEIFKSMLPLTLVAFVVIGIFAALGVSAAALI